jgi:signal transduction histidine kinase
MRKICAILFMFVLLASFTQMEASNAAVKDSIMRIANQYSKKDRLKLLNDWSQKYTFGRNTDIYAQSLLSEAMRQKDKKYLANAYLYLAVFYQTKDPDNTHYYSSKAEPLLFAQKRYEEFFILKYLDIVTLTYSIKSGAVLSEVNNTKLLAKKVNYPVGAVFADMGLAYFYQSTGLNVEEHKLYEECFKKLNSLNAPLSIKILLEFRALSSTQDIQKRNAYLKTFNNLVGECKKKGISYIAGIYTMELMKYLDYMALGINGILTNNLDSVKYYMSVLKKYTQDNDMRGEKDRLRFFDFYYSYMTQNFSQALKISEDIMAADLKAKRIDDYLSLLRTRNNILKIMGYPKGALEGERKYVNLIDSFHSKTVYKELATLRNQSEVNNLEVKNQQMKLNASQSRLQIITLCSVIGILALICVLLGYMSWSAHRRAIRAKKAEMKAIEADKMKSAFLANMNHEIRTPLSAIVGFSELITDEKDFDARKNYSDIIMSNNELLEQLIGEALDISKIESNSIDIIYKEVSLLPIMTGIYNSTKVRLSNNIELILDPCEDLTFYTDRVRLIQIMNNLINNAIKHTDEGHIRFGYKKEGNNVHFYVEDTGEGIPEDQLNTIFIRFAQLNEANKTVSGVGLGLAICKGILRQMNGTIAVTSTVGKGSTFSFTLPIIQQKIRKEDSDE